MREYVTSALQKQYTSEQLRYIFYAFRVLMKVTPDEHHFVFRFANSGGFQGQDVWAIIDDYPEAEGGRTATYLLPGDY